MSGHVAFTRLSHCGLSTETKSIQTVPQPLTNAMTASMVDVAHYIMVHRIQKQNPVLF